MSSVIRGINVKNSIQNKAYGILINRYPLPVAMSTKQASFNVLTGKDRSVRLWRSRFNLVSQSLTTFHMWWSGFPPLHGNISWGPLTSHHFWSPPKSFDLMLHTSNTRVHLTKWCQGHLNITQCPHCQRSFCPPLKISFQSGFSKFDNISHVMIWISTTAWQHFMRTYIIIFGVRPNLVISCCIQAISRFILQSGGRDWATGRFRLQVVEYKECQK